MSEDTSSDGSIANQVPTVDVEDLLSYVRKSVLILLNENGESEEALTKSLHSKDTIDHVKKFITDPQIHALLAQKPIPKDEEDPESILYDKHHFIITTDMNFKSQSVQSILFIKRSAVIEADKNVASQLRILPLSEGSPYEVAHSLISDGLAPFYKSFIRASGKVDRDGDKMVSNVEKRFAELEIGLLHLQQNIEIPEVNLTPHPLVAQKIKNASEQGQKAKVTDFEDKVDDPLFLNSLQSGVNRWIKEIQKVTKLDRDPASGTALQEIGFWLNLERALHHIQEKRESLEVTLTLDILKHAKRFHATVSFDSDAGLRHALDTVNDYNPLMKDFPLQDLLSAHELEKIKVALTEIFNHLRKLRNTKYPLPRALRLLEAISRDLNSQLLKVLGTRRLMHIRYDEFERVMTSAFEVFRTWDEEYDKLQTLMREMSRRRREDHMRVNWRIQPIHKKLQTRLENMRTFRQQHEQLSQVIVRVLQPSGSKSSTAPDVSRNEANANESNRTTTPSTTVVSGEASDINEVALAYDIVKDVDCLDVSKEGADAWEIAIKRYDERIDRVETRITSRLRDLLGTAKNANEMFRYFSRFNALFVRPHIRGAIREYQTQLIQRVKDDIEALHEKFKVPYTSTQAYHMSKIGDLPPVSGAIIWARQIERQLNAYLRRVEAVLGKDWEHHVEGQKLKADGESFKAKLNTNDLFNDWTQKVQQRQLSVSGRIFYIESVRVRGTQMRRNEGEIHQQTILKLRVNFHPDIITLAKEANNMRWLGFRVPLLIVNKAHQAHQLYPYAMFLMESIRTYENICSRVDQSLVSSFDVTASGQSFDPNQSQQDVVSSSSATPGLSIAPLCAALRRDLQQLFSEGCQVIWESYRLEPYVQKFTESMFHFQEKVEDLLLIAKQIEVEVRALETCSYSKTTFEEILNKIQKAVDELSLKQFSNLAQWVSRLDEEVERRLVRRLEAGLIEWTRALIGEEKEKVNEDNEKRELPQPRFGGDPQIRILIHELRITNQQIHLHPSIEVATQDLLLQLANWENIILRLTRIQHSRYQVGIEMENENQKTYKSLLSSLPNGGEALANAHSSINNVIVEAEEDVKKWSDYQALWDLQPDQLYSRIGSDIVVWMNVLDEIKAMRKHFDVSETQKSFGPLVIMFDKVQSKVSLKYDNLHKEILGKFGAHLGQEMESFYDQVSKARGELERQSLESGNTADAVNFITYTQSIKRKMKSWEKQVDLYRNGQSILYRDRFQFPHTWRDSENVQGEWSAFQEILKRKDGSITQQMASMQMKIVAEDKVVENKTTELLASWEKEKPIAGDLKPEDAVNAIKVLEGKFQRLREERDNMQKAKEALELTEHGVVTMSEERVQVAMEELQDLKSVWMEISRIWEQIEGMKEMPWMSVQPRKLRQQLDTLSSQLKELPSKFRQYSSYEHVKSTLQNYAKVNVLIVELKSEAVKERHWKQLMRMLNLNWTMSELSLGQLWDIDLQRNEQAIREVTLVAQGEKALEEFLKTVTEVWKNYNLELINYQNKCRLIRAWDDLFNKVKEHINSVTAMRLSPYFKQFEEEANAWEERLNRINALFDIWIDVQRRWVYLDGIFAGSADINILLPMESQRFQGVSTEFLGLMKKVSKSPLVMDVINIANVLRQLERLADLLGKIQKSLGEYLERQRSSFPRFYFVGDEDLLEIIGNSKNVPRLQKHFKKMFAGVHTIQLTEDNATVLGLTSKEGEEVHFVTPVSIKDNPKINDWLTMVEKEMRVTLAKNLDRAMRDMQALGRDMTNRQGFLDWVDRYQSQIVTLAAQINWSESVEAALGNMEKNKSTDDTPLKSCLNIVDQTLNLLADTVLYEQPPVRRKKLEHLIIEHVHQRDVLRLLIKDKVASNKSFDWLSQMRFYFDPKQNDPLQQLSIQIANAKFNYGFEYLGIADKLVQTPLTDRCYLTMTQALEARLGGSPFGPAGTGKTESVKALGNQLGRFVLVFNCDETFDFQAMGRIFVGLCQVGAWGCFDEFNRLEERMLSAVSQQIQGIQEALRAMALAALNKKPGAAAPVAKGETITVDLLGRAVTVNPDMAIFITMNPGYAGRSNLPDNLKKLFRSLAMTQPDRKLIAQVMLYSQGFRMAEKLASKVVPFFKLCDEQLSPQSHYDFGLRALKSVLVSAGNVKRDRIKAVKEEILQRGDTVNETTIAEELPEQEILIQSVMETMVPKLVAEDIPLLYSLLSDVFPGVLYTQAKMAALRRELRRVCEEMHLVYDDEPGSAASVWVEKVLQLYQISCIHHGLMMVGPSGSGKSKAWQVLLKALERLENIEGVSHVIDPKSISKDALYGYMDPNTREWTDGLFTHILRKIIDSVRGEAQKRQWIIFDGDVDPEWVENLNSVLDDNKLLTLPNGERLGIPPNVRIMFEVQDLRYATLATVSRCGMVWFSEDVLPTTVICQHFLAQLRHIPVEEGEEAELLSGDQASILSPTMQLQRDVSTLLSPHFEPNGLVIKCLEYGTQLEHIMDYTRLRALTSLFSMLKQAVRNILNYNHNHIDFPLSSEQIERYIPKCLIHAIIWSMSGDGKLKIREDMGNYIREIATIALPPSSSSLPIIDYEVTLEGEWVLWSNKVPQIEVETHKIAATDVVVPTLDTVRHEALLYTWLAEHRPVLLCGPPGSGKTMTLFSALRSLPDMEVIGLNFSSATTPELMLKTFDQYCEYKKTPNGIVLTPLQLNKWLIFFCDEINLPDLDKYGTQRVISFLRQMVEHGGFYRTSDMQWVKFERIQFVGACNPPTDPGRKPLSHRFLRHVPIVYVDYPGETSLKQIYGTFNRAMLRMLPSLRGLADSLTNAMVDFYLMSQARFTHDMQPHYIYSPREMTRWVRGIHEALKPLDSLSVEGLVRIWAHEALRLFQDRLVEDEEREWTDKNIDECALRHFPNIDRNSALVRPILFSSWITKEYSPVDQERLREYVKARLKVFYEEELDVPLVLFNQVLDHVLRIDRVFRQSQGHLLLIGVSGAGKTTLSRFVSWINGLSVFQVKVHNKYSAEDFDEDLRTVLRRSGCKGEKITFIMDESNVMDSSFLERMNTLLANGEVPGLFEGDEFSTLMTQCKEGAAREGLMLDSHEELYKWFTQQICRNLHVVFTMNPSADGLKDRAATSPALFNRCVLNWFGDWSVEAFFQVGKEFTNKLELDRSDFRYPDYPPPACDGMPEQPTHRDMVVNAFVFVHQTMHEANQRVQKRGGRTMAITPRHYLDFIAHCVRLMGEKKADLVEQQLHLNVGLQKIKETVEQVEVMQKSLTESRKNLEEANTKANAKLKQMMQDQHEAMVRKEKSQVLQQKLSEQEVFIVEKRKTVMEELSQVEPAVNEAKQAVQSIRKKDIQEIRTMKSPPPIIKMALESICLLLGQTALDWRAILQYIVKDNFVPNIINFNTDDITDAIRDTMKKKYLTNPDFNFEKVNRASNACGPMVKWAIAQVNYADMLKRVEPLRNELKSLEEQAAVNTAEADEVERTILQLEESIARYKKEYAELVSQAETIKANLQSVEAKVGRSVALLRSLGSESTRWEAGSETFKAQMATIIGDCLLSSAFMAYAGYYDQHMRQSLFATWTHHLEKANILFRPDLARVEYLSNPDDRLRWQANALPADELCTENAIIMTRYNRYPLIIDPSGQATEFLLNEYKGRKIQKTSFLDDSFRKSLESALRFGTALLVQDVESYDAILNPVLNREVRRTGGRTLITIGDQDIDISPTFTIFLSTRDPTVEFPPDICSRVTFVNFTVTRSSLQNQCLNAVLKSERPDVDAKRSDLLKLQGEFQLRLRHLEKDLLQSLNEAKGNILDDDKIITRLETLKQEAADVAKKVAETDLIMAEVESVSAQYEPLAQSCSNIYFTLEAMNQVHFLYQYSLHFLLDIFNTVLTLNPRLTEVKDSNKRLQLITYDLFQVTYNRVARGMLHQEQLTFALLLARIYLRGRGLSVDKEFQHFLRGQEAAVLATMDSDVSGNIKSIVKQLKLSTIQAATLTQLKRLPAFKQIDSALGNKQEEFKDWIQSVAPEAKVPELWDMTIYKDFANDTWANQLYRCLMELLLIQAQRPDRLLASVHRFVNAVLGQGFMDEARASMDLASIVDKEIRANTPILLCAVQGYDPSSHVEDLANELNKQLTGIAIGSAEGFSQADQVINASAKSGRWVMLKNVHLAPGWLVQLEKKLHSLQPHPQFRLFMTMEINPKLPVNLLRAGRVLVFEPPPGIKANMLRTFSNIPAARMARAPAERSRLYFLLCWFNAVVQERLRYAPLGWSKRYEFTESDLRVACDTIDTWVDSAAQGRTNLPPERVPWGALRTLLAQCIYGGKIDNEFDHTLMNTFLNYLFTAKSFEHDFELVGAMNGDPSTKITIPDSMKRDEVVAWTQKLPDNQTPSWLGLPNNAEVVLLTNLASKTEKDLMKLAVQEANALDDDSGQQLLGNTLKMQQAITEGEEEGNMSVANAMGGSKRRSTITQGDARPLWMRQLHQSTQTWLHLLPGSLTPMQRTAYNIKDPLYRCFEREVNTGLRLLLDVRKDLTDVIQVCQGERKPTNHHRGMMSDLAKGIIPTLWRRYTIPQGITVIQWMQDFALRVKQLIEISDITTSSGPQALRSIHVWLGGLFMPEAYITATRQTVAQQNTWALEELCLDVELLTASSKIGDEPFGFVVTGLQLMGAQMVNSRMLQLSSQISSDLPVALLKWIRIDTRQTLSGHHVSLPVYLNASRAQLLFTLEFNTQEPASDFYKRGIAILSSTLG